jgi:hypothetical protein
MRSSIMRNRHPKFRHAQRHGGPYRKTPLKSASTSWLQFGATVLISSGFVASMTWVMAPHIQSAWSSLTMPAKERAKIEQSVYYHGCSSARSAGVTPIYRGSPGYRAGMDGDGDGIACEDYY